MKNFLFGVLVGATGMGLYTGHIKIIGLETPHKSTPDPTEEVTPS